MRRYIISLLICFLLLCILPKAAVACCDPECGDCEECVDEECVDCPDNCCGGSCCSDDCCGDSCGCDNECCNDVCCGAGDNCCAGSCCANECCNDVCCGTGESCCDDLTCYDPSTDKCCSDGLGNTCPVDKTCCEGDCCTSTQKCCDGSCCDKVWTKETVNAINESCPSAADCYEPGVGCDGIRVTVSQSYDSCLNVGVGEGEHCECNEEIQVVGYKYTCQEDWDWSMMSSCAFEAALCFLQCVGLFADPASCSDCLGMLELDCCGGSPCHICDFLESCDPTNAQEVREQVFTSFGC